MTLTTTTRTPQATSLHGILITLVAVMPVMAIVTLVPVLPMLGKEFASVEGSEYLVPAALTIPAFCLAIFSPAAGWIADRVGRKNLLIFALVLYSGLGILPYFLTDLIQIIGARFVLGIMEAAIMTVATTLIGDYFKGPNRERWLGIQVAAISVAAVVLVWLGGMLGHTLGSRGPFLLYLVGLPLALVCFFVLFEPMSKDKNTDTTNEASTLPWKRLTPMVLGGFVVGILFYVIVVQLGNILALKTTVDPNFVGQMSAITNAAMILGSVFFGIMKSRFSAPSMISFGALLMAIGYSLIPGANSIALTVLACSMVTFSAGIILPTFLTWIMSFLTLEVRGRGTGMWQGAFFLGQFIAPIVAVAIAKQLGGLEGTFYAMSALAITFCAVTALKIKGCLTLSEQARSSH